MKRTRFPIMMLTAVLLLHPLQAFAEDETLTLAPPEKMPPAVGRVCISTDRSMNGAHLALYRVQLEGAFLYYEYDVSLREGLTVDCPVWEGSYQLAVTMPSDVTFEYLDYRFDLTVGDPEMDPEQSFDTTYLTLVLDTDQNAEADTVTPGDPVIQDRIVNIQNTYTFARAEFILGDLNGDSISNAADAAELLISAAAAGAGTDPGLTSLQQAEADLNGDGTINSADAAELLTYAAVAAAGDFEGDALTYIRSMEERAENVISLAENNS